MLATRSTPVLSAAISPAHSNYNQEKVSLMEVKSLFDKLQKSKKLAKAKKSVAPKQPEANKSTKKTQANEKVKNQKINKMAARSQDLSKGRKKTEEGFNIYTEEELKLAEEKGGDTADCPFDCECCF